LKFSRGVFSIMNTIRLDVGLCRRAQTSGSILPKRPCSAPSTGPGANPGCLVCAAVQFLGAVQMHIATFFLENLTCRAT
jgi:hypothetical protein